MSTRAEILALAGHLTAVSREETYGNAAVNMGCAGKLKAVVRDYQTRTMSPEEAEAIDMCLTKISRIVTGPVAHLDNYTDLSAYGAIAGEFATTEPEA